VRDGMEKEQGPSIADSDRVGSSRSDERVEKV
jgi:hypothetical protein